MVRWKADPPSSSSAKTTADFGGHSHAQKDAAPGARGFSTSSLRSLKIRRDSRHKTLVARHGMQILHCVQDDKKQKSSKEQNSPNVQDVRTECCSSLLCDAVLVSPTRAQPPYCLDGIVPDCWPCVNLAEMIHPPQATRSGFRAMQTEVQQRSRRKTGN